MTARSLSLCLYLAGALAFSPFLRAADLDLEGASIADIETAYKKGTLTVEKLVSTYLARIEAYDKQGPAINALIYLNPKALEEAKAADVKLKAGKAHGALFGIPVILKDNINTFDMPTTAGSQLLSGSIPSEDAFITKRLREAGAIILAKSNLSEFAAGGGSVGGTKDAALIAAAAIPQGFSSEGGQTHNPHNLEHNPAGSSGGSGAAIAASFAQVALGTDTTVSVRGPSSACGIVGLRPSTGLMSRTGIVPISYMMDTAGPMARRVSDVAVALGVMAVADPTDGMSKRSGAKFESNYTKYLKVGSLKGARIGVLRAFMGQNAETDRVIEESIATLKQLGAVIVDPVALPDYAMKIRTEFQPDLNRAEFKVLIAEYLKKYTKPEYPKSIEELATRANDPAMHYRSPGKAVGLKYAAANSLDLDDPAIQAIKNEGFALIKAAVRVVFADNQLDAIIYPTVPRPAGLINAPPAGLTSAAGPGTPNLFASEAGCPELVIPAGMTTDGLPVTLSFMGKEFTEAKILAYGYDFEQATKAIAVPKMTPILPGDHLSL